MLRSASNSGKGVADAYLHATHSRNTGYGNTLDGPYTAAGLCRDLGIAGQIQNGVFHQEPCCFRLRYGVCQSTAHAQHQSCRTCKEPLRLQIQ